MPVIYRQKPFSSLTPEQQKVKLKKDGEYEIAVQNLYTTLPRDQAQAEKKKLWNDYSNWAIAAGLYEEVTVEQQLTEAEAALNAQLEIANQLRTELEKQVM